MSAQNAGQFNIRWNNHTAVLQSGLWKLLENERLVDATLSCEGGNIKCHRIVLSACSPYFENLLMQYPEEKHFVIFLKDTKLWTLKRLVHFMYHGEISVNQSQWSILIRVAKSLQIRGLSADTPEGLDNDEERVSEDEDVPDYEGEGIEPRGPPEQDTQRRQSDIGVGDRVPSTSTNPRFLVRGTQQIPSRQSASAGVTIEKVSPAVPKKRMHTPAPLTGPPRLTKMLKLGDKEMNGNGSVTTSSSDTKTTGSNLGEGSDDEDGIANPGEGDDEKSEAKGSSQATVGGRRFRHNYPKEVRESVLANLESGMSITECTDVFGIPRKTISKWRKKNIQGAYEKEDAEGESVKPNNTGIMLPPVLISPVIDAADRADRLKNATALTLYGITVRQAAAHFGIPRTTLCAYMKRKGIAGRRPNPPPPPIEHPLEHRLIQSARPEILGPTSSNSNRFADFPLFGLSEIVNDLVDQYKGVEDDGQDQDQ